MLSKRLSLSNRSIAAQAGSRDWRAAAPKLIRLHQNSAHMKIKSPKPIRVASEYTAHEKARDRRTDTFRASHNSMVDRLPGSVLLEAVSKRHGTNRTLARFG
jgi:hypothetical protein